ncbi:hypothetical protein K1T71_002571 [Dendrolimus kikuchii]|uniref:Uncharacterized protein n=1 Tax=Dendrolimus kikuchii TaxID=765133 RepID=A0ACC1DCZ2_9NEOP|nr:hypothetical protein K1T71_002571 [Dendrolimus kikuchii]
MRILTYFVFTLLSIFIQFCVMDFIQEKMQIGRKQTDLRKTSQKVQLNGIIQNISNLKSHALYYNITPSNFIWNTAVNQVIDLEVTNVSIEPKTTDNPSSVYDFYDENSSMTEFTSVTAIILTSTDIDNITEITLFHLNNQSSKANIPKTNFNKDCNCNFLYKICDINCCCDYDCNKHQQKLFSCSSNNKDVFNKHNKSCNYFLPQSNIVNNLLCIAKTNLPDKRIIKQEKWRENLISSSTRENHDSQMKTNEFIWIQNKGSIIFLDIPTSLINSYCTDRQPVKILNRITSICNVKLNDLEMFHILNIFEEGTVASPIENVNSTAMNCTTLICASCNIMACVNGFCSTYNKSVHEPMCKEDLCINVAIKIDLIFYYNNLKITNVTIKLHMDNITMAIPYVKQEISIDFVLGNISKENVLEFSGSPGYIIGRPIIISHEAANHTDNFYKVSNDFYFRRPSNKNGLCVLNNSTNNFILFGINKRTKCRYIYTKMIGNVNYTTVCKDIHKSIKTVLGLNDKIVVSPYGNPYGVEDNDWVHIKNIDKTIEATGEMDSKTSRLNCYNIATSVSLVFAYEDLGNKNGNKILQAECEIITQNKSFDVDDFSTVITIDVNFVDLSTPGIEEYASGPYINIALPKAFFYPFPSNNSSICHFTVVQAIIYCTLIFVFK